MDLAKLNHTAKNEVCLDAVPVEPESGKTHSGIRIPSADADQRQCEMMADSENVDNANSFDKLKREVPQVKSVYKPSRPETEEIRRRLYDIMRNEYHQRGDYAIRMLDTAEYLMAHLPEDPEKAPYFGTAVASCLRQAVMEIFKAGKDNGGLWRKISRRVTNAKQNYEKAESSNKHELLQHLIGAISDLEKFHEGETSHEYRLKQI